MMPSPAEHRLPLRTTGMLAGALVGASAAWLVGGVAVWALMVWVAAVMGVMLELVFVPVGPAPTPLALLLEPWLLWPLLLGALAGPSGWLVSWLRLRRWGAGRAFRVTAAASSLVAIAGVVVGACMVALVLALMGEPAFRIEQIAPIAGGLLGAGLGARVGAGAWPWLGVLQAPRPRG